MIITSLETRLCYFQNNIQPPSSQTMASPSSSSSSSSSSSNFSSNLNANLSGNDNNTSSSSSSSLSSSSSSESSSMTISSLESRIKELESQCDMYKQDMIIASQRFKDKVTALEEAAVIAGNHKIYILISIYILIYIYML